MQLHEQYRPKQWSEVVAQDKAINQIEILKKRGLSGRSYWISGQSGTGKTTIAKLLASEIASDECINEIDAGECTIAKLREIETDMNYYGFGKAGRAYIINESHGLRKDAIRQLLVLLERLPKHVMIIFTTTSENQENLFEDNLDANPLLSRCTEIALSRRDLAKPFAERARTIAQGESLDGQPIEKYIKLAQNCRNNMRMMLQQIESGIMAQ